MKDICKAVNLSRMSLGEENSTYLKKNIPVCLFHISLYLFFEWKITNEPYQTCIIITFRLEYNYSSKESNLNVAEVIYTSVNKTNAHF